MLFCRAIKLCGLIVACLIAQLATGQSSDRPAKPSAATIEAFLKVCETTRRGAILQFEHELRGLQSTGASDLKTARRIRTLQLNLEALHAGKHPVVPTLSFPPEIGAIGRLPRLTCHVDRVLSANEMLVRVYFPVKVATVKHFQRMGDTAMPAVSFFVRGVPTAEYQAGRERELTAVLEITGRQTGNSAGGISNWVLEPFDMSAVEAHFGHDSEHTP
jgi:hypothetical protein